MKIIDNEDRLKKTNQKKQKKKNKKTVTIDGAWSQNLQENEWSIAQSKTRTNLNRQKRHR